MRYTTIAAIILAMIGGATSVDAEERRSSGAETDLEQVALVPPDIDDRLPDDELVCLALTLYWEGRGESRLGQKAVGHVVVNRARAAGYPDHVCAVVTQGGAGSCQFSWYCDGRPDAPTNRVAWWRAVLVAKEVLANPDDDPTGGALYFHRKNLRPAGARAKAGSPRVLGDHVFFRLIGG
jgi:N-acetylmuramoyl-L-alanine amidase